jgi:hypothetical protein
MRGEEGSLVELVIEKSDLSGEAPVPTRSLATRPTQVRRRHASMPPCARRQRAASRLEPTRAASACIEIDTGVCGRHGMAGIYTCHLQRRVLLL